MKAGASKRIKSMQLFLESHPHSHFGIRFWANTGQIDNKIHSYPLYAVAAALLENNEYSAMAIASLVDGFLGKRAF
ncbi:hypothetical protein BH09DEP1_BH09DEP1_5000 [soil metagenome]